MLENYLPTEYSKLEINQIIIFFFIIIYQRKILDISAYFEIFLRANVSFFASVQPCAQRGERDEE